jgi:urease accessory protein UreH
MARRDERNRNNRKRINETTKITRPLTKNNTRTITSYKKDSVNMLGGYTKGDSSAGRLKAGPNAGRNQNKLKIDVKSAGSGSGLNVPR